jgi:hypothetical protein
MEDIIEEREDWGRIDMVEFVLSMVVTVGPHAAAGTAESGVVVLPRTSALIERHHE